MVEYLEDYLRRVYPLPFQEPHYEMIDAPLWWHLQGLSQTASGYGAKLNSGRVVKLLDGRSRRVYITQYSNAGSAWIMLDGKRLFLRYCLACC